MASSTATTLIPGYFGELRLEAVRAQRRDAFVHEAGDDGDMRVIATRLAQDLAHRLACEFALGELIVADIGGKETLGAGPPRGAITTITGMPAALARVSGGTMAF